MDARSRTHLAHSDQGGKGSQALPTSLERDVDQAQASHARGLVVPANSKDHARKREGVHHEIIAREARHGCKERGHSTGDGATGK
jgi:hypothetical protein